MCRKSLVLLVLSAMVSMSAEAQQSGPRQLRNPRLPRALVVPFPSQSSDHPDEDSDLIQPARLVLQNETQQLVVPRIDLLTNRTLKPNERLITILGTNDIHGALETDASGKGGMALWAGVVQAIRAGLKRAHGDQVAVVLLDGGDQLQGTLISAKNEGEIMIRSMALIGYDGIVPGNHDYDFGPVGFLQDQVFGQVDPNRPETDPRGVIRARARDGAAATPFVSANTFLTDGLFDTRRQRVMKIRDPQGCVPDTRQVVDFAGSIQPNEGYLRSSNVFTRAGVSIAVVGIDSRETPTTTNSSNVIDLCFAEETQGYAAALERMRRERKQADLFLVAAHAGDPREGGGFFKRFIETIKASGRPLDAIVGGHTHQEQRVEVGLVHAIQSGANGMKFGRIDLIYDIVQRRVIEAQSESAIEFTDRGCDPKAARYCAVAGGKVFYEGAEVERPDLNLQRMTPAQRRGQPLSVVNQIDMMVKRARTASLTDAVKVVGQTGNEDVKPDRISDNSLGEIVTDAMRAAFPGAQAAVQNMGGLRITIPARTQVTFEHLFRMMPFNNHAKQGKVPARVWVEALRRAAKTCGEYPTLIFSGIVAEFQRTCIPGAQTDERAVLVSARAGAIDLMAPGAPDIETVSSDFLADGGDGYLMFRDATWVDTGKVMREELSLLGQQRKIDWAKQIDFRWKNRTPGQK